ncbi:TlpA disulfide reductase family protein [Sulfitobacter guttiformis]|uniref:Thiol-disulfide isomerase/thioredoxin n=1 Tax=Sulfitobacter guttiformis TaxID=74349 RepID=A0A420DUJ3_9RHOB|nr:TlpA disulfide reductase family protein [Sulfitobacter guttiformis]KIN71339.1 putative thiol:disulfide interchange protein TlpA [Sulfitobacter guttiformis KCTC 32187]RKE97787.1 thiol-disulfide isomerase/thioredoxin [Sulfitobacter guttiformis]
MKKLLLALVYTALTAGANPALAADSDIITPLIAGDMKKLAVHGTPKATSNAPFELADGAGAGTLEDYRGKYVLVNFWATWCAPCRKEMPHLSELQTELGGDDFEVLTIATGRNSPAGITKFFEETGISNLPRHQDPKSALASQMGIFGLPITVLVDPEGREVARLRGDADWASDSAKGILKALIEARKAG